MAAAAVGMGAEKKRQRKNVQEVEISYFLLGPSQLNGRISANSASTTNKPNEPRFVGRRALAPRTKKTSRATKVPTMSEMYATKAGR